MNKKHFRMFFFYNFFCLLPSIVFFIISENMDATIKKGEKRINIRYVKININVFVKKKVNVICFQKQFFFRKHCFFNERKKTLIVRRHVNYTTTLIFQQLLKRKIRAFGRKQVWVDLITYSFMFSYIYIYIQN